MNTKEQVRRLAESVVDDAYVQRDIARARAQKLERENQRLRQVLENGMRAAYLEARVRQAAGGGICPELAEFYQDGARIIHGAIHGRAT